jgi:mannose-6-phosphate isomerase-like protein (cupin superfamily)
MQIVKKEEASIYKNNEKTISVEYDTKDKDINIAYVEINGRHPEKGRVINKICKELIYVVDGIGKLYIENKIVELKKDDVVLIEPNEKYYFEGELKVIPACYPAWDINQVELID